MGVLKVVTSMIIIFIIGGHCAVCVIAGLPGWTGTDNPAIYQSGIHQLSSVQPS